MSDDFVKCQLVLAMCQGVTLSLCNNDFIPLMDTVINELFNTSFLLNSDWFTKIKNKNKNKWINIKIEIIN